MRIRTAPTMAWTGWTVTALSLAGQIAVSIVAKTDESDAYTYLIGPIAVMGMVTVGTLIVSRRQGNRIGWILIAVALAYSVSGFAGSYARYALDESARALPAATLASLVNRISVPAVLLPLPLLFLLFPDGNVPSRRWRPLLWVLLAAILVNVIGFGLTPGPLSSGFIEIKKRVDNPIGLPLSWKGAVEAVTAVAGLMVFFGGILAVAALILRFRRARGDERQQIKWLAYVGSADVIIVLTMLGIALVRAIAGIPTPENDTVANVLFVAFFTILLVGIPGACAIAAFKYRLYELDVVVKKTVVFGLIALAITGVGLAVVAVVPAFALGISGSSLRLVVLGIGLGLLVWPFRRWATRVADRIVYGRRATPYEVLSEFADRVAQTYSMEDVLPRMAQILARATGAQTVTVWLRIGSELRPATTVGDRSDRTPISVAGDSLPSFEPGESAFEVRHQGELLGALTLMMPPNDPMNPQKERVAVGLAAQGGLVLRNVRLIEELRASRQRLVAAQDEERRKIERNIHDGAQQQLVALSVKLRLAEQLADKDPTRVKQALGQVQAEATEALENLRDLARGIYPPLLADKGLREALSSQARKSSILVTIEADGIGRYRQEIEAAVYFCALEALQNVAKYAGATSAVIRLAHDEDGLRFEISDDGAGFDPASTPRGSGLQNMADRLEAIGGRLEVDSRPAHGTTVRGSVPARTREGKP
jgi:signal transduction histidine kinase